MSRALFMAKLKEGLADLPQPEIDEIASDYEHHFSEAAAIGQSEDDVVARLGDPARLARELRGDREQRISADEELTAATPPSPVSSGARMGSGLGLLLALIVVIGVGAVAYRIASRDGNGGAPASVANLPVAPPAPPAPPQQAVVAAAGGAKVMISGGQVLDLGTITQDKIEIMVDGGGRAIAKGRVKELTLYIDGSGSADFGALQADIVHVDVSGTGNAEVSGAQLADITILGSGTVRLAVNPKTLKQSVTGSGQIILPSHPSKP
jgi:hypothetical protein